MKRLPMVVAVVAVSSASVLWSCGSAPSGSDAGAGGGLALGGGFVAGGGAAGGGAAGGGAAGGGAAGGGSAFLACGATYAGCTTFMDETGAGATVNFNFSTTFGTPRCIRVRTSQSVSLTGVSGFHPLAQQCGPDEKVSGTTMSALTLSGLREGLYGFYCPNHGDALTGTGMGLAIQVVP